MIETASLRAETAALSARLEETRRKSLEAKAQLADSQRELDRIQQEVLVKFGNTEDLARTFAAKLEQILPMITELEKKEPLDADAQAKVERATKVAMELLPFLGQLRQMDEQPEQAGRFASTLLAEVLKLPPDTTAALERVITEGYSDLKRDGLTLSARPKENADAWSDRRAAVDKALTARVLATLPETAKNHPILKLLGSDDPGILLPPEAAFLGNPGANGDAFLRAAPSKGEQPARKQP